MKSEEFRRCGYLVVDRITDYMERLERDAVRPVQSGVRPGEILGSLPSQPPAEPESIDAILDDFDRIIMPGITHWQSPSFFGYFPSNISGPSILGELLAAGLGVQGMLWTTSPACTEVEMRMMDWLVRTCGLPEHFSTEHGPGGGVIQGSASEAALCAIVAARQRALADGADPRNLCGYISTQTHSSIEKSWKIAGLAPENLHKTEPRPDDFSFDPVALAAAITADRVAGRIPFFVTGTIGTTSTAALDPLCAIGKTCRAEKIWFHVDGAYGGSAMVCPELRGIADGLELADSYCFNPHKWLLVNFDCDCFFVADRRPLVEAMTILPEYLRNAASDSGTVVDYRDWQVPLGRRFRALKLWMTIRYYGITGLQAFIRRKIELGARLAETIAATSEFEIVASPRLALTCFAHRDGDDKTREIVERCNASGEMLLSNTVLKTANGRSRFVIRMHTASAHTEWEHVEAAWRKITDCAKNLR